MVMQYEVLSKMTFTLWILFYINPCNIDKFIPKRRKRFTEISSGRSQQSFDIICATFQNLTAELNFIAVQEKLTKRNLDAAIQLVQDRTSAFTTEHDTFATVSAPRKNFPPYIEIFFACVAGNELSSDANTNHSISNNGTHFTRREYNSAR